jgi:proteasome lid subunit RPN8/RPN11
VRELRLPVVAVQDMRRHARDTYPDECCGFLIGPAGEDPELPRAIERTVRARNEYDGARRRRFVIDPNELRELERRVAAEGRAITGFYHSHPDHPAEPSEFDREHAWPWYSYVVLRVTAKSVGPLGAFELDPETEVFAPAPVQVEPLADWSDGKRTPKSLLGETEVP